MSLEIASSHLPHFEGSRSILGENLADKQKKIKKISNDHSHSFVQIFIE